MTSRRALTALVGLAGSLLVSALVYHYTGQVFVFLLVPFVPLFFRGVGDGAEARPARRCPDCGYRTRDSEARYCPRDGAELVRD